MKHKHVKTNKYKFYKHKKCYLKFKNKGTFLIFQKQIYS